MAVVNPGRPTAQVQNVFWIRTHGADSLALARRENELCLSRRQHGRGGEGRMPRDGASHEAVGQSGQ